MCILENEVGTKPVLDSIFMVTNKLLTRSHAKVFGIGSMEIM